MIGIGIQDGEANIKKFASDNAMPWPVGFDAGGGVSRLYGITFGAGIVFIDRNGTVTGRFIAGFKKEDFEKELKKIL